MAADPPLAVRPARAGPAPAKAHRPVSFAECLVQELPKLPSLAALRALTDRELPSTDGIPMPESMVQGPHLRYTVEALRWWFATRRPGTCVAGDVLVYAEGVVEADGGVRARSIAPDVLVSFGVGERLRDSYVMWREGKAPDFVLEIASESTWRRDRDEKPGRYAALGVGEYFLYDPEGGRLEPRLQGYVLEEGAYRRLPGERLGNGAWGVRSPVLGLSGWLRGPRGELRWRDPDTGRDLEDYAEAQAGRAAAEARAAGEAVTRRAAEAENAELRAQLRRLRR
ncbi:MAG: Uma2 family endonuclease [Chromatiales bacterium]|nr:Uma2 family endonuclease [Chromatiales bacterium]